MTRILAAIASLPGHLASDVRRFLAVFASPNMTAQYSHFAWGYGVVLTAHVVGGHQNDALVAMLCATAIKEFYVDKHYELGQTFRSNATDFASYVLGMIAAIVVAHVAP